MSENLDYPEVKVMRNLSKIFVIQLFVAVLGFTPLVAFSQIPAQTPSESFEKKQQRQCEKQNPSLARTYDFREYPEERDSKGAHGTKHWYDFIGKVFPFLKSPEKKYALNDVKVLQDSWGLETPLGESKRSYEIRMSSRKKLEELQQQGEQNWEEWLKLNPNAGGEEKNKAEIRIRFQGLGAAKLKEFDWRKQDLDVGEVGFQGWQCGTCWAFASVDAAQISRRLAAIRAGKKDFNDSVRPNVRQLVSCMVPKAEDYCNKAPRLGDTFTYLVDQGLPLGGASKYGDEKLDWECDPQTRVKALTWDYVSKSPQEIPSTEELKEALIVNGPLVTALNMDLCLPSYGGRVFNEVENSKETTTTFHVVLIIGWDDKKEAWLIKNSYGTEWGEKGFGWIKYGSNNIGRWAAFIVPDPKEEERISKELNNGTPSP